jgi:hypothetical protein
MGNVTNREYSRRPPFSYSPIQFGNQQLAIGNDFIPLPKNPDPYILMPAMQAIPESQAEINR